MKMLTIYLIEAVVLCIINCQLITGFVVQSNGKDEAKPEESQFFAIPFMMTIGSHLWSFLNGCFLDVENLKKLVFP
uniref:Hypotheticial protein n=1 Tax=Schistosoma japonicum TaxID=6182 RepID=C1L4E4_SCHJA|nr:hypotheticial protein [Schistosoma japonicum]